MTATHYIFKDELTNYKDIKQFPNPIIFEGTHIESNEYVRIWVIDDITITVTKIEDDDRNWFLNRNTGSYLKLHASNGHFPTRLVTDVNKNGIFDQDNGLSQITGYVHSRNLGTSSVAIKEKCFNETFDILSNNRFNIEIDII